LWFSVPGSRSICFAWATAGAPLKPLGHRPQQLLGELGAGSSSSQ
jgi:hypothetical protein